MDSRRGGYAGPGVGDMRDATSNIRVRAQPLSYPVGPVPDRGAVQTPAFGRLPPPPVYPGLSGTVPPLAAQPVPARVPAPPAPAPAPASTSVSAPARSGGGRPENQMRSRYYENVFLHKGRDGELVSQSRNVGEGMYGLVTEEFDFTVHPPAKRALKRIRMDTDTSADRHSDEGMPITAIREVKLLKHLNHPNIVRLIEIVLERPQKTNFGRGPIFLVFEYVDHDLNGLHAAKVFFDAEEIRFLSHQLLTAIDFLHGRGILHRDVKGSNILIDNDGNLKLADFGLARRVLGTDGVQPGSRAERRMRYTNRVITLWYRPPELLLGGDSPEIIGPAIDVWSCGCIIAEMFLKVPLFPGRNEIDQLEKIFDVLGTPSEQYWPEIASLPLWKEVKNSPPRKRTLEKRLDDARVDESCIELLQSMLSYNPNKRISAAEALEHRFYEGARKSPAVRLRQLPNSYHEYEVKARRIAKLKETAALEQARREKEQFLAGRARGGLVGPAGRAVGPGQLRQRPFGHFGSGRAAHAMGAQSMYTSQHRGGGSAIRARPPSIQFAAGSGHDRSRNVNAEHWAAAIGAPQKSDAQAGGDAPPAAPAGGKPSAGAK